MSLNPTTDSGAISPFVRELAINQLRLGALKALSEVPPSEEELESARLLKNSLLKALSELHEEISITRTLVSENPPADDLVESIATLRRIGKPHNRVNRDALEGLVNLLQEFLDSELSTSRAEELLRRLSDSGIEEGPKASTAQLPSSKH